MNDNMMSNNEAHRGRPARSPAGDAFTHLVVEVAWLGANFTATGEHLARVGGQTLARWVVLDAIADQPATVAQVARLRGIARQAVQRVADLLVRDGLAAYEENPRHRRAQLMRLTPRGQDVLREIAIAQKAWADALGAKVGIPKLERATSLIREIRGQVAAHELAGSRSGALASGTSQRRRAER